MPDPTLVLVAPGPADALRAALGHTGLPALFAGAGPAPAGARAVDGRRRPAPGRLCCCVADPLDDRPLTDAWPPWARAADVGLVVVAPRDALRRAAIRPERLGLLHVADVVLEADDPAEPPDALGARLRDACRRAAAARAGHPVPHRPRIGVITPWPPDRAGPATSMRALVRAAPPEITFDVVRGAAGAAATEGWDATLCSLGDSPFHLPAWRALMDGHADVLLHDARLGNLYEALHGSGAISAAAYRATVLREAHRLPVAWRTAPPVPIPRADADRLGLTFLGDVLDRAARILVHSEAARAIVLGERPDRAADVRRVIHGGPAVTDPPGPPRDPKLVATFGYPRDPDLTLRAFAHARARHAGLRLAVTGDAGPPAERARLRRLTAALGIDGDVTFEGWVDDATWAHRLRAATVALQLRGDDRGESSATIAACLAAGIPVITTAVGAALELPADAVVRVPPAASPATVGDALAALVADPGRRAALADAGRRWQAARQPADAARSLAAALLV